MKSISGIAGSAVAAPLCRGVRKVVRQLPDLISMAGWVFLLVCVCGTGVSAAEVALTAAGAPEVPQWHYRTAIPFPAGALMTNAPLELLDAKGQKIPCEFNTLATWHPSEAGKEAPPGSADSPPRSAMAERGALRPGELVQLDDLSS